MLGLSRIGLALLLLAVATVAGQNPTPVQIRLGLLQSVPLPLGWVVAAALAMGILSSTVIGWLWGKPRLSTAAKQLQARLQQLEAPETAP
ncbi:MAG: LapA family protein [Thermostichales cyanobacterium DRC_bins_46]